MNAVLVWVAWADIIIGSAVAIARPAALIAVTLFIVRRFFHVGKGH